eukprot:superscaffoldBa00002140_g13330
MPAITSKNSDLEFDSLQPCFYPDEDDFYFCGPDSAPPGEDIWKKFELLPTPPLSPSRAALPGEPATASPEADPLGFGLGDPLDWASELLLLPEDDIWGASDDGDLFGSALDTNPNSIIIQDCMWSGFSAREKLERVVTEKLGKAISTATGGGRNMCVKAPEVVSRSSVSECVDPAVVFPFPVNKKNGSRDSSVTYKGLQLGTEAIAQPALPNTSSTAKERGRRRALAASFRGVTALNKRSISTAVSLAPLQLRGLKCGDPIACRPTTLRTVPRQCSSAARSVKTLEKRRSTNKASPMATGTVTISVHPKSQDQRGLASGSGVVSRFVSRAPQELILKRSSVHQQQHNYAAPSPYASDDDPTPPPKKQKTSDAPRPPTRTISSSSSSSSTSCSSISSTSGARSKRSASGDSSPRGSSDSEDSERRRNHNILERQRRNDLRSSFLMLRDHVPELAHNEKAAKVLILKKATDTSLKFKAMQKGVVPISVKKALLGLIPTRRRTQGSSPQPRPGQPPPPDGTLSSFVRRPPLISLIPPCVTLDLRAASKEHRIDTKAGSGEDTRAAGIGASPQRRSDTQPDSIAHKTTLTKKKKKNPFQPRERISCLFLLPVTRATLAPSRTPPSPPRARLTLLPHPRDPLDCVQRHVKFIPPHAASQQALDSGWRAPEAKGGVCAADPPQSGVCLCGVHLNQQGHGPKRPLFPFPHHLTTNSHWHGSLHTLPTDWCVYECSESHSAPPKFLSENEESGNNARLNKHFDN